MDGLSGAASVIAVIDISAKIASLCYQYSVAVKDAKDDIERVRRKVSDIAHILEKIKQLLNSEDKTRLPTTQGLFSSLEQCLEELKKLEAKLDPGKTRKTMSRFGFRALKWPFTSKQVDKIVLNLEGYEQTFSLALQVDQTVVVFNIDQKLDLARLPIAIGASFNSYNEEHNARCLPNTRTELLDEITTWANNKDGKSIFWLSGMAGTGKSTIARTIAESFADHGQLGASFFFKRGEGERGKASRFFTTIATDLVACEPGMLQGIRKTLDEDPAISNKALKDQFEKLILQPLLGIKQTRPRVSARVVVIDALDECEREADIRAILQLLARTKDLRPVPLRIVVTSRPELHIRLGFKEMANGTYQDLVLHEVPRSTIEHDIRLFLEHELGIIRKERMLASDWPAQQQILALVELAVPLFIYAATVCRYVGSKGSSPTAFLNKVLQYQKATFSQLDRTYLPVLDQLVSEQEEDERETWLQAFREVVGSIVVLESPLPAVSLARLLQVPQEEIQCRLDSLHSVLSVPNNKDAPVRLLHLSFREFLVNPQKQGKSLFWVDEKSTHQKLASRCLELMSGSSGLRQDMCGLSGPGVLRDEIDEQTVAGSLSPDLQYACRYWVDHLKQGGQGMADGDATHLFLQKHFLHWLEAMSLIRESSRCVDLLNSLQALASVRSLQDTPILPC
ncbi:AAA-16 multi-domain protein [Pyrenophora tritici-repentis]|nr:AAA-16 multi-domain protein [Pyrenophora tritici-repentis]